MNIWSFILEKLEIDIPCILMVVLDSQGSSPGRQGFKMAVAKDSTIFGSIGGGIMEHKLVEKAKDMLKKEEQIPLFKEQVHRKDSPKNQSGMICSGQQIIVLCPVAISHRDNIKQLNHSNAPFILNLNPNGISFSHEKNLSPPLIFDLKNEEKWNYKELISQQETIHIIGGGHVGLAFSEIMNYLGFRVLIYDNRPDLNTMKQNNFAHEKIVVDYERIGEQISASHDKHLAIMTFSYRTDKSVLKQLIDKDYKYLGIMGSSAKIKQLFEELEEEGISSEKLRSIYAPIGLSIHSKTPQEIAVSIAAQIIQVKNTMIY